MTLSLPHFWAVELSCDELCIFPPSLCRRNQCTGLKHLALRALALNLQGTVQVRYLVVA